jgi:hypothetical protein
MRLSSTAASDLLAWPQRSRAKCALDSRPLDIGSDLPQVHPFLSSDELMNVIATRNAQQIDP